MDRRVRKTRDSLKNALIDLIYEKDFENITILDITEKADVNRGTFYHHYYDKFDLLDKMIEEKLKNLKDEVKPAEGEETSEGMDLCSDRGILAKEVLKSRALTRVFQQIKKEEYFYKPMFTTKVFNYFYPSFIEILKGFIEAKIDKSKIKVDKGIFVNYILFAYLGVVRYWIQTDMAASPEYMGEQLKLLLPARPFAFRKVAVVKPPEI